MKRKDKIIKEAKNRYPYIKGLPQNSSNQAVFVEAAEWADQSMIERVCKWLDENMTHYEGVKMGYIPLVNIEDMINDFRKAMFEEE